ncbi:hypothetical protein NEMBOFW57_000960 [Staphylotrichum longicolle]|uniref:Uncharacterized protein n=1 Tax=Staphylotrichum longicolle TaxID=669026 RepID=A0AAD4F0N4_9PEZI|nr:hypothetical protein NEMBOFW57_000960 [Staphylotrichum longicolle]
MDHFNATIKDGKLVKTRRGLQVSRQKFNGLSFVNASPQEATSGPGPSGAATVYSPAPHEIRFIEEGSELQNDAASRKDAAWQESSEAAQGTRRRRKAARRGLSPATPLTGTLTRPSPSPSGDRAFKLRHTASNPDMLQIPSNPSSPASGTPEPNSPLRDEDWDLFQRYIHSTPRSMYPYEDMLSYNVARTPEFHAMVAADVAAVHCVLMCGRITEGINSQTEPKDLAYHISKICAILNRKLSQHQTADAVTLHCIAKLARVGCYVGRLDHWDLHMRGLQKVLDLNGGLDGLPPWLVAELHK